MVSLFNCWLLCLRIYGLDIFTSGLTYYYDIKTINFHIWEIN